MRDYQSKGDCVATLGSVSQALRAQKLLRAVGIRSEVIQADGAAQRRGCAYALSFPCYQKENVKSVLLGAGIRAKV